MHFLDKKNWVNTTADLNDSFLPFEAILFGAEVLN